MTKSLRIIVGVLALIFSVRLDASYGQTNGIPFNVPSMAILSSYPARIMASYGTFNLNGYYAGSTAGGGTFTWLTAAQAAGLTPDGGVVIAPSDHPADCSEGCLKRQLTGPLTQFMFGAKCDGVWNSGTNTWSGTDDYAALQAWQGSAYALGVDTMLQKGAGACLTSASVAGGASIVGGNGEIAASASGVIPLDYSAASSDRPLLNDHPIIVRDATFDGYWETANNLESGEYCLFMSQVQTVIIDGVTVENCRFMGLHLEYGTNATVKNSTAFQTSIDSFNIIGFQNVDVENNFANHSEDNCIGVHTRVEEETVYNTAPDKSEIVAHNTCYDTAGINVEGAQHTLVTDNILKRSKASGIQIAVGFESVEGYLTPLDITVARNIVTDTINPSGFGVHQTANQAYALYVQGFSTTQADTVLPETYWYENSASATLGKSFMLHIYDNNFSQTLQGVSNYSDWGYGQYFTVTGYVDPAVAPIWSTNSYGIAAVYGALSNGSAERNYIYGFQSGVDMLNAAQLDHFDFIDNQFVRLEYFGFQSGSTSAYTADSRWIGNKFDLDPYYQSTNRNEDHTWNGTVTGLYPTAFGTFSSPLYNIGQMFIRSNTFRNMSAPIGSAYITLSGDFSNNIVDYESGTSVGQPPFVAGTTASNALTLNQTNAAITTESLTTAAGAFYSFTWTNSWVNSYSHISCDITGGTNGGGTPVMGIISPSSGSAIVRIANSGTTAFNGTVTLQCTVTNNGQ